MSALASTGVVAKVAGSGLAAALSVLLLAAPSSIATPQQAAVTFTGSFTQGDVAREPCTEWNAFRAKLSGSYSSITLSGSRDPTGRTCTGPKADTLCQALRKGEPVADLSCDGNTWNVDYCADMTWELAADGTACSCVGTYDVRPCIGTNGDWGGVDGPVCESGHNGDQTITVACR